MNLLRETKERLEENGKASKDVKWVGNGSGTQAISWINFAMRANFEYDDGWGSAEIALELVVGGDDWWLERYEYDGSECWQFKTLPTKEKNHGTQVEVKE